MNELSKTFLTILLGTLLTGFITSLYVFAVPIRHESSKGISWRVILEPIDFLSFFGIIILAVLCFIAGSLMGTVVSSSVVIFGNKNFIISLLIGIVLGLVIFACYYTYNYYQIRSVHTQEHTVSIITGNLWHYSIHIIPICIISSIVTYFCKNRVFTGFWLN
jgi:hypothetical protein